MASSSEPASTQTSSENLFKETQERVSAFHRQIKDSKKTINDIFKSLSVEFDMIEKDINKLRRQVKLKKKGTRRDVPSGFRKQVPLSKKFLTFFKLPPETRMSNIDAANLVHKYVETNQLKNPDNGRLFHNKTQAGKKLFSLLEPPKTDTKAYEKFRNEGPGFMNLQSFLRFHLIRNSNDTEPGPTSSTVKEKKKDEEDESIQQKKILTTKKKKVRRSVVNAATAL